MPKVMVDLDDKADKNIKKIQFELDTEKDVNMTKPEVLNEIAKRVDAKDIMEEISGDRNG